MDDSKAFATAFLTSLLSKTLRITTSDTRLFVGEFKCTDADRNIILSRTYEYRLPSPPAPAIPSPPPSSSTPSPTPSFSTPSTTTPALTTPTPTNPPVQDLTSRYLGLIVVPGEYVTKVELEEFASQKVVAVKEDTNNTDDKNDHDSSSSVIDGTAASGDGGGVSEDRTDQGKGVE